MVITLPSFFGSTTLDSKVASAVDFDMAIVIGTTSDLSCSSTLAVLAPSSLN